ncbi:MAG TPA: MFS transporter [Opitutus sp.]|nr:MFS transporter [Opitutus sp.]
MPPTPASDRLSVREYVGYALGDTASNFFFQTFNIFLTYYYVDVWGIPATALLLMMPLTRLWDAVNDPLMGAIADRTRSRWGKFRPYLLWGAIPYGICGYLMFAGPHFSPHGKLVYAYVTYSLMLMAYTVINVPYSSLLGVISPSSRTRTVASSYRFVGAFGGGLLISLFVRPLVKILGGTNETLGFQYTIGIFAVVSIVMFWITFGTTRERVTPPPQQKSHLVAELGELFRNGPWLALLFASIFSTSFIALRSGSTLFYFKYCAGDKDAPVLLGTFDRSTIFLSSGALAMMLGCVCLGTVARRIDKRVLAAVLSLVTGASFAVFFFLPPDNFGLLLAINAVGTFCMGPTSALVWSMFADVADFGEWKFHRRSTGLIYSSSLFALKTGIMVGGFVLPWFLARFGFVRDAVQTASAVLGIKLAFSLAPGLFAGLKAIALLVYPLKQPEIDAIEAELAARRAASAA